MVQTVSIVFGELARQFVPDKLHKRSMEAAQGHVFAEAPCAGRRGPTGRAETIKKRAVSVPRTPPPVSNAWPQRRAFLILSGQAEAPQAVPCRSMFHYIARPHAVRRTLVNVSAGFLVVALSRAAMRWHGQPPPCFSWLAFWSCLRPRADRVSGRTILARSSARLQQILSASIVSLFDARHECLARRGCASALLAPRLASSRIDFLLGVFFLSFGTFIWSGMDAARSTLGMLRLFDPCSKGWL